MSTGTGRAPGKVILLGEHAVVYGRTALAAALDRAVVARVRGARPPAGKPGSHLFSSPFVRGNEEGGDARLREVLACARAACGLNGTGVQLTVESDLPMAVGLGSSAALSVALVRALAAFAGRDVNDAAVCRAAFECEKIFHGHPSGVDNTVATYGGVLAFRRELPIRPLAIAGPIPLVVAVGRAPRATRQTVTALRARWQQAPEAYEAIFDEIAALVSGAETACAAGDWPRLGTLMRANHRLLQRLGVSTPELDDMVELAHARGALGAKLTGGGGGGAVICLAAERRDELVAAFAAAGWSAFRTDIHPVPRGVHAFDAHHRVQPGTARA
jgi:hydroxymethylglutaryl-CoA reductase